MATYTPKMADPAAITTISFQNENAVPSAAPANIVGVKMVNPNNTTASEKNGFRA
jgi:hypothetical protein